jgi:hypothetical protein
MYRSHLLDRIASSRRSSAFRFSLSDAGAQRIFDDGSHTGLGSHLVTACPVQVHASVGRGETESRSQHAESAKCETAYNAPVNDRRKRSEVWWRRRESNFSTVHGFCSLHILRKEESAQSDTLPDLSYAYRTQSFFSFDHSPTDRIRPLWCFVRSLATNVPDPRSDGLSPLMTAYDRDTDVEAPGH